MNSGKTNLGVSYILKRLQTLYLVLGNQIPNFGVNSGKTNLGVSYILKRLQTAYLVLGDQIPNFRRQLRGFPFWFFIHAKASPNTIRPKASNILENAAAPTPVAFGHLRASRPSA